MWVSYAFEHRHDKQVQTQSIDNGTGASDASAQANAEPDANGTAADGAQKQTNGAKQTRPSSFGHAIVLLVLMGIASPFLELASPGSGILGLVILFVGLSIAFRLTKAKPLSVDGPYSLAG